MWEKFLNGLASEGGNIFVLFFLILIVGSFVILKFNGATDQLYFVLGALVGILKGKNSNNGKNSKNLNGRIANR